MKRLFGKKPARFFVIWQGSLTKTLYAVFGLVLTLPNMRGTARNDHVFDRVCGWMTVSFRMRIKGAAARNRSLVRSRGTAPARMAGASKTMEGNI